MPDHTSDSPNLPPLKRCTKCGIEKPATPEYFLRQKSLPSGMTPHCKECNKKRGKEYYESNRDKESLRLRRYQENNKERIKEYNKQYRLDNLEKRRQEHKDYYEAHRDAQRQRMSKWIKNNRGKLRVIHSRYRARKKSLPDTFTAEQWQSALDYFNNCCAVCGRTQGLWHKLVPDHWIPISSRDCPGTIPTNIVPLCHGQQGCNNRKRDKNPEQWLIEQLGAKKAKQILKRIQDYFDSLKR